VSFYKIMLLSLVM